MKRASKRKFRFTAMAVFIFVLALAAMVVAPRFQAQEASAREAEPALQPTQQTLCGKRATNNGYLVVIDAGHQKKGNSATEPIGPGAKQKKAKVSSGATGNYTRIPEYKLTLKMAKKLKKELKSRGYQVKMVRTKHDVNISNSQRAKIANRAGADAFIRIHANSSANTSVSGALTISPTKNNRYCKKIYKKSSRLSKCVLTEFCKATGAKNRGVMYTDTMSGINWSKVPVTIVEMGFLSNKKEDIKMNKSAAYQAKMAKGIADGIDRYLKRK